MKYETTQVKAARINMFDLPTWLKLRNKPKYQSCPNCGVDYKTLTDSGIGVIYLVDEKVIAVCNSCAEHFIQNGSTDILKVDTENYARKREIIAVLASEFNIDIKIDYSIDWLETHLKNLQNKRSIEIFNKLPIKAQESLKYICSVTKTTLTDMFFNDAWCEIFSNYSKIYSSSEPRWYNRYTDISVGGKIGERNFKWDFCEPNGDSSLLEMDWEFVFESLEEIELCETISDSEVLDWLDLNSELPQGVSFRNHIKQKMLGCEIN